MIDMKKLSLIIIILCVFFRPDLSAQKPHSDLHHEIGVDAGPASIAGVLGYGSR